MAKWINDAAMDAELAYLQACDKQFVCSQQPSTYAQAATTYCLATANMTTGTDFVIADGDTNGRKVTVAQKTGVSISGSGTANHVCLGRSTGSTLRHVTTCTDQVLTSGGTLTIPAHKHEIADPT